MTMTLIESSPSQQCNHKGSNATPFLDAQLHQPAAREAVSSVHTTMQYAVDGEHCTRCTANEAARTLTKYVFDMRDAKQRGNFSREEKRAMKAEVKALLREVKGVIREEKMSRKGRV